MSGMTQPPADGVFPGMTLRAWCFFKVVGGVLTLLKSSGVSGVVRNAVGDYTISFAANMPSVVYGIDWGPKGDNSVGSLLQFARAVGNAQVKTFNAAGAAADANHIHVAFYV